MTDAAVMREFLVPGMHCGGCMRRIEDGMGRIPGIRRVRANLSTRRVSIAADEALDDDALRSAFESIGFHATPFDPRIAGMEEREEQRRLLRALAVAGFGAANVMLLSVSVWAGLVSDMDVETRQLFHWISALIALPAVLYAGRPFFHSALRAIKARRTNMDVPISLAVLLASGASLAETIRGAEHVYFDAALALLFFLLIGRVLDLSMRAKAGEAARNLLALAATSATVEEPDGKRRSVAIEALRPGMLLFVAPGMRIAADGIVADGRSDIDMSLLTGETTPKPVGSGARVLAGTLNLSGPLHVRVEAAAGDTVLAEIARLMETAEQRKAAFVRLADRIAGYYAPFVHMLAALTFFGWLMAGAGWHMALMTAVAVLIVTCPCALGLAVPVVQVVASGALLRRGIIVKSADGFERLAHVDHIVFDKTGTLTRGEPVLLAADDLPADRLALAAALAAQSRHPLARAVVRAIVDVPLAKLDDVREHPGLGIEAMESGRRVRLGRREWAGDPAAPDHDGPELWLSVEGEAPYRLRFCDTLRSDAAETIAALGAAGYRLHLFSGDRPAAVSAIAQALGIEDARAAMTPADKIAAIEALKASGARVLMIGDGLNDAPALAAADASISPADAADIAQIAADFLFQGEKLGAVATTLSVAQATNRRVRENFALAFLYNLIAVPIAVFGYVTPLIAAIAMSGSSLLVTLNALRVRGSAR
ncbi:MAG: heavy metal translocating P-type ATPase metal-binding domain-containing protein [Rhodothalassiaceae bacterium]